MGNVYGYVRVSSIDQNEDRQMIAMSDNNVRKAMFILISSRTRILSGRSIRSSLRSERRKICCTYLVLIGWDAITRIFNSSGGYSLRIS